jgi:glyoxylase-like metal-dependent hydrolase (beta-lactamase superfamily II)
MPDIHLACLPEAGGKHERSSRVQITAHVVATPGHTPVVLNDGRVFAGDLLASGILLGGIALKDRPKQPPYKQDTIAVAKSLQHLLSLVGKSFYLGHGGPLSASRRATPGCPSKSGEALTMDRREVPTSRLPQGLP